MHLGLRPPIDGDLDFAAVHAFLARKTVPSDFIVHVRIQLVVAKFTSLLVHNISEAASASLMRLIDGELDVVKSTFSEEDTGSHKLEFSILAVKLHFYALLITRSTPGSPSSEITLKSGLAAALRITYISALRPRKSRPDQLQDSVSMIRRQRSLPKNYYRGLAFATIFLLTFFHLNSAACKEEQQSAATHIAFSQGVFEACTVDPQDEFSRAAKVFETLARLTPGNSDPSQIQFTHRMGVSILLDAVITAAEARGKPVHIKADQTLDEAIAGDSGREGWEQQSVADVPYTMEQMNTSVDFFRELWDDPIMNMLNFEALSPPHD